MKKIVKSFIKRLKDYGINLYLYDNSDIDISLQINGNSKTDLPLGTETTFVLQDNDSGQDYIITLAGYEDYILNRYVRYKNEYIRITAYDNTTGEITLESGFGEAITSEDVFQVLVVDSMYVSSLMDIESTSTQYQNRKTEEILDLRLQTKLDGDRQKISNFKVKIIIGTGYILARENSH